MHDVIKVVHQTRSAIQTLHIFWNETENYVNHNSNKEMVFSLPLRVIYYVAKSALKDIIVKRVVCKPNFNKQGALDERTKDLQDRIVGCLEPRRG